MHVWDLKTGKCLHRLLGHAHNVKFIASFSNDIIASASDSSTAVHEDDLELDIKLWQLIPNTQILTPLANLTGHAEVITAFCKVDDKLLITGSEYGDSLKIWDIKEKVFIQNIHLPQPQKLLYLKLLAPGLLACSTKSHTGDQVFIHLYDISKGFILVQSLTGHKEGFKSTNSIINLSDEYFASGDTRGTIKLWNIKTRECLQTLETSNPIHELGKLPNGYLISTHKSLHGGESVHVWAFPKLEHKYEQAHVPKP